MESLKNKEINDFLVNKHLFYSKIVQSFTLEKFINEYITEWDNYYKSIGINNYKSDEEVTELLEFAKNNDIINAIENVKSINIIEENVVKGFEEQIYNSLFIYDSLTKDNKSRNFFQSIFIEDDFFPHGNLAIYGEGDYKVLLEPEYIDMDLDYNNMLFNENCKIDFLPIVKKLIDFNQIVEDHNFDNFILDSNYYNSLSKMYRYKVYSLLSIAFKKVDFNLFKNLKIKYPFYVFANEHDCEVSSIYIL